LPAIAVSPEFCLLLNTPQEKHAGAQASWRATESFGAETIWQFFTLSIVSL